MQLVLLLDFGFNRDDLGFALAAVLAMCAYAVVPSGRIGFISVCHVSRTQLEL